MIQKYNKVRRGREEEEEERKGQLGVGGAREEVKLTKRCNEDLGTQDGCQGTATPPSSRLFQSEVSGSGFATVDTGSSQVVQQYTAYF